MKYEKGDAFWWNLEKFIATYATPIDVWILDLDTY